MKPLVFEPACFPLVLRLLFWRFFGFSPYISKAGMRFRCYLQRFTSPVQCTALDCTPSLRHQARDLLEFQLVARLGDRAQERETYSAASRQTTLWPLGLALRRRSMSSWRSRVELRNICSLPARYCGGAGIARASYQAAAFKVK